MGSPLAIASALLGLLGSSSKLDMMLLKLPVWAKRARQHGGRNSLMPNSYFPYCLAISIRLQARATCLVHEANAPHKVLLSQGSSLRSKKFQFHLSMHLYATSTGFGAAAGPLFLWKKRPLSSILYRVSCFVILTFTTLNTLNRGLQAGYFCSQARCLR